MKTSLLRLSSSSSSGEWSKMLDSFSQFNPSPLSIKQFIDFGRTANEQASYLFLKKELPVRLANIMKEINLLPPNLLKMPSTKLVQNWYTQSFREILQFQHGQQDSNGNGDTKTELKKFCDLLATIRNRHSDVVPTMAQGILELKESHSVDQAEEYSIQYFLDRFYMSRISIRMLISQHTLLFGEEKPADTQQIGSLHSACRVMDVVRDAYENARFLCDRYYLASPGLRLEEENVDAGNPIEIVYVPSHLYHMFFELFKNALRAVVEHYGPSSENYPDVEALVVSGEHDVTVKIFDRGGGIPREKTDLLFQYMYSTAPQPPAGMDNSVPLAGYGYGLPISRLYARYFQGDLILTSYEGYGTDAIIYLKRQPELANELLPIFNTTSSRVYTQSIPTGDWSGARGGSFSGRKPPPTTQDSGSSNS